MQTKSEGTDVFCGLCCTCKAETKYICLICQASVCNRPDCSVFLPEETLHVFVVQYQQQGEGKLRLRAAKCSNDHTTVQQRPK